MASRFVSLRSLICPEQKHPSTQGARDRPTPGRKRTLDSARGKWVDGWVSGQMDEWMAG
jgi:hypothetical protein